jgi:hypothetical protein
MRYLAFALGCLLMAAPVAAQDSIAAARDLYASAAYEEALAELDRARQAAAPPPVVRLEQYRAFALYALGRVDEAEGAAELAVKEDPLLRLDDRDASPKVQALFRQVQRRLLPGLARDRFRSARTTLDEGHLEAGLSQLAEVRKMLAEAKSLEVADDGLTDLGVLVDGFIDLTRQSIERKAAAKAAAAAPPPAPEPPPAVVVEPPRPAIFSAANADVTPPVVLRQDIPTTPQPLAVMMRLGRRSGVIEVRIDERGNVEYATMREPIGEVFDSLLLAAARNWQYKPATRAGVPVKYLKHVGVTFVPPQQN